MKKDEKDRRRERLRLFANNNQWMKKKNLEQTLEDMSVQLREYRRDLQQIRMQEAATEAKIDRLQQQVNSIEEALHLKKQTEKENTQTDNRIADFYEKIDMDREGYTVSYSENGMEREETKSTVTLYA